MNLVTKWFKWLLFLGCGFYLLGVLTVIPLPEAYQWYRPQWLLMFFIYCQLINPRMFNAAWAWGGGLLLDSLLGCRLGEHALVFGIICYTTALIRPRFLSSPFWQQIGKVFLLVCLGQIFILWFHVLDGQNPHTMYYWVGGVTSSLIWPLFVWFLQSICRTINIIPLTSQHIIARSCVRRDPH